MAVTVLNTMSDSVSRDRWLQRKDDMARENSDAVWRTGLFEVAVLVVLVLAFWGATFLVI